MCVREREIERESGIESVMALVVDYENKSLKTMEFCLEHSFSLVCFCRSLKIHTLRSYI